MCVCVCEHKTNYAGINFSNIAKLGCSILFLDNDEFTLLIYSSFSYCLISFTHFIIKKNLGLSLFVLFYFILSLNN